VSLKAGRRSRPWDPLDFDEHDVSSMKALATGTANEGQQKRALRWILDACRESEQSFVPGPDGDRITAFVEGKRAVGNQIWTLIKLDVEAWKKRMALHRKGDPTE
jgi:hypothetical protein